MKAIKKFLKRAAFAFLVSLVGCAGPQPKPDEVSRATIDCTATVCDGDRAEQCARLVGAALTCLASHGNVAACMGGIPALVQVGYADLVCVVDALDLQPLPEARANAEAWMRSQRVEVMR